MWNVSASTVCEGQRVMGDWRDKAACRDMDPDLFFPATRQEERLALKACSTCPSIRECARYAAEHARINGYPLQGIWGGINRSKGKNYRNNETEMWELSIADDEAEKAYPTRYWNGTHVKEQFYCDTDDLQEAYLRGRSAPHTNAEIEAVAKRLCWDSCEWDGVDSYAAKDEDDAWNYAGEIPGFREGYIRQAKEMLEIARKAVNE